MIKSIKFLCCAVFIVGTITITGCGQTGPLYLPQESENSQTEER